MISHWIKRIFRRKPTARQLMFIMRSAAKDCCKLRANLTRTDTSKTTAKNTCCVCGANHYYMHADPIRAGAR